MARVHGRFPRIPCVVPFCGCGATCYEPGCQILCPKHYRLVDKALKARRRQLRTAYRKRGLGDSARARWAEGVLWRRMVEQAITRAGGAPDCA